MTTLDRDHDYSPRSKQSRPPGGSPPGTVKRHFPPVLRLALQRYMMKTVGGGSDQVFIDHMGAKGARWTLRTFGVAAVVLDRYFPVEMNEYVDGRKNVDHLLLNRHHKMFWQTSENGGQGRYGITSEHPSRKLTPAQLAASSARLKEVGFPY